MGVKTQPLLTLCVKTQLECHRLHRVYWCAASGDAGRQLLGIVCVEEGAGRCTQQMSEMPPASCSTQLSTQPLLCVGCLWSQVGQPA